VLPSSGERPNQLAVWKKVTNQSLGLDPSDLDAYLKTEAQPGFETLSFFV
jgi:hypothetical protein